MKIAIQILIGILTLISCTDKEHVQSYQLEGELKRDIERILLEQKVREHKSVDSLILEQNVKDSIRLINFRLNAFNLLDKPIKRVNELISGNGKIVAFQNSEKFLYLRFNVNSRKQKIEFYSVKNQKPSLMWEEIWEDQTFVGDTIRDINGDYQFDVLTNFYPSSGCCRRNSFWIRLFDSKHQKFAEKIRMINPTFYPKEKIVRGVDYGHPGEVPIYKMKWRSSKLDTLEYIYPFQDEKDKFLVTKKYEIYPQLENPPKGKIIYSLPEEYNNIEDIGWFLDY